MASSLASSSPEPLARLPKLLIIGAMKSGTTTLYMDLADRAGVYLAENKEPHSLCYDKVLTDEGLAAYAALYRGARPDQLLCDASTGYTKQPLHTGVIERALKVLPEGFKVIYLLRHPVERALSHYRHDHVAGDVSDDIDHELRTRPEYLQFSQYARQLRPWLDALGPERVRVVAFERFVAERSTVLMELAEYLGTELHADDGTPEKAYNQSKQKPRRNRLWDFVYENWVYRRLLRPLVPLKLRLWLFQLLLPKSDPTGLKASEPTLAWLRSQLAADAAELSQMIGAEPLWPDLTRPASSA